MCAKYVPSFFYCELIFIKKSIKYAVILFAIYTFCDNSKVKFSIDKLFTLPLELITSSHTIQYIYAKNWTWPYGPTLYILITLFSLTPILCFPPEFLFSFFHKLLLSFSLLLFLFSLFFSPFLGERSDSFYLSFLSI